MWISLLITAVVVIVGFIVRYFYKRSLAKDAMNWLAILREGHCKEDLVLKYMHEKLKKSGYSLADIYTSEGELNRLRINCFKGGALVLLTVLRQGYRYADNEVDKLLVRLKELNLCLADIGTDVNEIKQFRINGHKIEAEELVSDFRTTALRREEILDELRALRKKIEDNGEFTLAEIGTSTEELQRLTSDPVLVG